MDKEKLERIIKSYFGKDFSFNIKAISITNVELDIDYNKKIDNGFLVEFTFQKKGKHFNIFTTTRFVVFNNESDREASEHIRLEIARLMWKAKA
jgi:hypothetical protein